MTPKRHAIAKEIIKLLYPGPPFAGRVFCVRVGADRDFSEARIGADALIGPYKPQRA